MIFRHLTPRGKLPSILKDGYLKANSIKGRHELGCVSLEEYKGNDILAKCFNMQGVFGKEDLVPLYFDSKKMLKNGIEFKDLKYSKAENKIFVQNGSLTEEEYNAIGDYYFPLGNLSLEYLTDQSKRDIGYKAF